MLGALCYVCVPNIDKLTIWTLQLELGEFGPGLESLEFVSGECSSTSYCHLVCHCRCILVTLWHRLRQKIQAIVNCFVRNPLTGPNWIRESLNIVILLIRLTISSDYDIFWQVQMLISCWLTQTKSLLIVHYFSGYVVGGPLSGTDCLHQSLSAQPQHYRAALPQGLLSVYDQDCGCDKGEDQQGFSVWRGMPLKAKILSLLGLKNVCFL